MNLRNRTILVTGGSAGIGLAFALKFVEFGNEVIVTGRRQAVLDEVKAKYPKLHTIQSDVANPEQIAALAARVKADFPKLDVLMNNAGIMLYENLKAPAADLAALTAEMDINVGGVIRMTSAFIDILTANKGTVINVSSALAFAPLPATPIYSATKAAIHSYTLSLRFQLEESGVEVIELMPPGVKTALSADLPEGGLLSLITTDELVKQSFASLKAGALEIRPGQSKTLALMRRLAPDFINGQLWKASKKLVPVGWPSLQSAGQRLAMRLFRASEGRTNMREKLEACAGAFSAKAEFTAVTQTSDLMPQSPHSSQFIKLEQSLQSRVEHISPFADELAHAELSRRQCQSGY